MELKRKTIPALFIVADVTSQLVLGLKTSTQLNLIKRIMNIDKTPDPKLPSYLNEFKDCVGEIDSLRNEHHIITNYKRTTNNQPASKNSYRVKRKSQQWPPTKVKMNIIAPIEEPTDWVNSIVVVGKPNGNLRICIGLKNLIKAIKRPHYVIPKTEEIISKMWGAERFTKLDGSNAYWQFPIHENSSELLTFNSPTGRYRFLRSLMEFIQ